MKTLKGKPSLHLILILLLIATSCVPDSLTKFKEDGASSDDASSSVGEVVDPPSGFIDENGNEIDGDKITDPTSVSYSNSTHIFITGDSSLANATDGKNIITYITPDGQFGDYNIVEEELGFFFLTSASKNNFLDPITNPGFNFGSDITTTYAANFSTNNQTGLIEIASSSVTPVRSFTLAPINFNFYSPSAETAQTITTTSQPRVTIQAPIPERLTFETQQSFNCTGTGIGTTPPASPAIGDVYLSAGTCYYNYDGTNTNTVAFPFTGPVFVGFEVDDNSGFLTNDLTSETFTTENGATGTITYKDSDNNIYGTLTSGSLYPGDQIDNAFPFSNREGTIEKVKYFFQPDSNINLKLINDTSEALSSHIGYENSTNISITPDLPSTLRLVKDVDSPLFGYIIDTSGATDHSYQSPVEYTVTVNNDISTRTFKIDIGIINPPEDLSYSQLVAFKVKNLVQSTSNFTEGQEISSATLPPLSDGAKGIIKRILDIDGNEKYLIVQVISGEFVKDISVDNYKDFLDEEAVIQTTPVSLTHIMSLNSTAAFTPTYLETRPALCMRFPAAPSDKFARAVVTGNPTDAGLSNVIFVNQTKNINDINSSEDFLASNNALEDCGNATAYVLNEIWTPVMRATFTDVSSLVSGMDILTSTGRANLIASQINSSDNTALLQSTNGKPITMSLPGEAFSSVRPYSANGATISDFQTLTTFELHRGVDSVIKSTLPKGEDIVYSVTPDLPPGLSLDEETGDIVGSPEVAASSKTYTVTAQNILGSFSASFDLLIEDYFEVNIEVENTPKFFTHKDGEDNFFNKCRVKKRDIVSNPRSASSDIEDIIDIDCYADIGENNLYFRELKIQANVGPGICHSVRYKPFFFYKKRPMMTRSSTSDIAYSAAARYIVQVVKGATTDASIVAPANNTATDGLGDVTPASTYYNDGIYINGVLFSGELDDLCSGKYHDINCDNGSFEYAELVYTYTEENTDTGDPAYYRNTVEVLDHTCDGNPYLCRKGAIEDVFSTEELSNGFSTMVIEAFSGLNYESVLKTPQQRGAHSNRSIASFAYENSCYNSVNNTEYYSEGLKLHADSASLSNDPNQIIDPFMGAQPYYTFSCLDEFSVTQARINLHIRDWDNNYEMNNLDKVTIASMDEGTNTDVFDEPLNEFNDWDDYTNSTNYSACTDSAAPTLGNSYTAITTGNGSVGSLYFYTVSSSGFYSGLNVIIGGQTYIVKRVYSNAIQLTRPLHATFAAGTAITGRQLIPFPYNDWEEEP
ncbi:hypothetical protein [Bacteriovorax sp. BAL6_X]|uniref:hypothetical protein n=1 Tax=Bacteriovorax sp. BAL6_X TaxID=1201290 RepID=UPI00058FDBEF|nr:hypothetical protein [Bacteriovorax sp. BAL6_X]